MSPDEAKAKADELFDRLAALAPQVLEVVREARDFESVVEAEAWSEGDVEGSSAEYYLLGLDRLQAAGSAIATPVEVWTRSTSADPEWLAMNGFETLEERA